MKRISHESILLMQNRELARIGLAFYRNLRGKVSWVSGLVLLRGIRVIRGQGLAAIVLFAVVFSAGRAAAQGATPPGPVTDNDINRVAHQLYCPVCESIPLDVCPTQACIQWRATIGEKLAAGWTDQRILDYFVAQYGERVLARP